MSRLLFFLMKMRLCKVNFDVYVSCNMIYAYCVPTLRVLRLTSPCIQRTKMRWNSPSLVQYNRAFKMERGHHQMDNAVYRNTTHVFTYSPGKI